MSDQTTLHLPALGAREPAFSGPSGSTVLSVLVACEYSGTVRDAFAALGHDAWSCDMLPTERPGQHYQGDVRDNRPLFAQPAGTPERLLRDFDESFVQQGASL